MKGKNNHWKCKPVVMELFGKPVGFFYSLSDAGRKLGCSIATASARLKRNIEISGVRIRFPLEGEDLESMKCLLPHRKQAPGPSKAIPLNAKDEVGQTDSEPKVEDKPLDRDRYNILPYEVRNSVECITPCPYKRLPRPMIGSVRCKMCSSFHGIDRNTHEVACSKKFYE